MKIAYAKRLGGFEEAKKRYKDAESGIQKLTVGEAQIKGYKYTNLAMYYEVLNFCGDEMFKRLEELK